MRLIRGVRIVVSHCRIVLCEKGPSKGIDKRTDNHGERPI